MATLILTAVGTAIGGPIGGAIGALAGQAIDATIFRPKGREGPRLSDLRVQTSIYGGRIPRLHGRMRVAGSVIWSTDLIESSETSGGGKGSPSVTNYSYAASFAVALSARPIRAVGRIWADGTLLRGAAGDFKVPLGAMRLHDGRPGQMPDPLIAAATGIAQASAHRDLAYVVFEDLQLADFGNRIPTLTFEVIADEGEGVVVADIAAAALTMPVTLAGSVAPPRLAGYACDGENVREALAPLVEAFDLQYHRDADDSAIQLVRDRPTAVTLHDSARLARVDGEQTEPARVRRRAMEDVPHRVAQRYYDPARDYQSGIQSVDRPGPGVRSLSVDFPAVLDADTARAMAQERMQAALRGRISVELSLGWAALSLGIGDTVSIEGMAGVWRIAQSEWADMATRLILSPAGQVVTVQPGTADPGVAVPSPDHPAGPTTLALIELPAPEEGVSDTPLVFAAATGPGRGWRGAALYRMEGETATPAGAVIRRAVIGTTLGALSPGGATLPDRQASVIVALARPDDLLLPVDDAGLARGRNLCMIGAELLQFGAAQALGSGRFRLAMLARGLRGTEWACAAHADGEHFVLLDDLTRLTRIPLGADSRGQTLMLNALGIDDETPAGATIAISGTAMLPPAPVHARTKFVGSDLRLAWTRRSRAGWRWADGGDVPIGEEQEAYQIEIIAGATVLRTAETDAPEWTYAATDHATDLAAAGGAPLVARITQRGSRGVGRPALLTLLSSS